MTIRAVFMAVPVVLKGWIGVLTLVAYLGDGAPAYVVLFPAQNFLEKIPKNSSILATSIASVTLTSDETGLARALYESGAWLVLPAGLPGCLPQPKNG